MKLYAFLALITAPLDPPTFSDAIGCTRPRMGYDESNDSSVPEMKRYLLEGAGIDQIFGFDLRKAGEDEFPIRVACHLKGFLHSDDQGLQDLSLRMLTAYQ